jgi:8-oxo-dGTP diphosphatase
MDKKPETSAASLSDLQPTAYSPQPILHVVAGALLNDRGEVLIAQRPLGKHMAGEWEFPGGKLAVDEASLAGLKRELKEELNIEVLAAERVAECTHDYPDRRVHLELWLVPQFTGELQSLDGQALKWVAVTELEQAGLLPADKPLVAALLRKLDGGL